MQHESQDLMVSKKISVVIIEDHKITLDGLNFVLSQQADLLILGSAETFTEGFAIAKETRPDVILVDLHLPDSPGPKSLIRQLVDLNTSKVVVFSGEKREVFIEAALAAGASAYVLKYEPASVVADTIRKVMNDLAKRPAPPGPQIRLSPGEKQILRLLAQGCRYQDIADSRFTSVATVKKQCERLQEKLSLESREQLIAWAVNNGFNAVDE